MDALGLKVNRNAGNKFGKAVEVEDGVTLHANYVKEKFHENPAGTTAMQVLPGQDGAGISRSAIKISVLW